jgi:hypothetical protein
VSILMLDARWRRLLEMGGPVDIGFDAPADWPHGDRDDAPVLAVGADRLAADLCRLDDRRFLRVVIAVPILGADDAAFIAAWAEVDHPTFYAYVAHATEGAALPGPAAGVLANDLALADIGAALDITFVPETRPEARHPAFAAPLTLDALLDLYAALGQDLRPMLARD